MPKDTITMGQSVRLIPLSQKIPNLVGRKQELERVDQYLSRRNLRTFLYYYAAGGLGKTRLLEEIVDRAKEREPEFRCSGIIDLYHTDIHSRTGLQAAIADGLDPANEYFAVYREKLLEYYRTYDPAHESKTAKELRRDIEKTFHENFSALTKIARVVLCLDTFEHIQYPSTVVDQAAVRHAPDLWLSSWLMDFLAGLTNVLVVFAGRPRPTKDAQRAYIETLRGYFKGALESIELKPLMPEETETFISALPDGDAVLPADLREVAHNVTEGKPIFLHLLVDLLRGLHPQPRELRGLLEQWKKEGPAFKLPEGYRTPQEFIQAQIINSLYNETGALGGYLGRIALLPKGVNEDILVNVLELKSAQASELIETMRSLSFIKQYHNGPFGEQKIGDDRLFLHDELYTLMTSPRFVPTARHSERDIAAHMVKYLEEQVTAKQQRLGCLSRLERTNDQRQIEELQLESLYYSLVAKPKAGYDEYLRLAHFAIETDNDDFGMKLLDEFLRFYNDPKRALQLGRADIKPDRMARDRTLMWMERLHWSEHYPEAIKFAEEVMARPTSFEIRADAQGIAVLGNITALWLRDCQMTGQPEKALATTEAIWERLSTDDFASDRSTTMLLARARLATSIGYYYDDLARLDKAEEYYDWADHYFREFKGKEFNDEVAFLLNNLAYLKANRGRMEEATDHAFRARRYFLGLRNERGEAYALSTLANVEIRAGDYDRAIQYANEALERFERAGEERGIVFALLARSQARRKEAKPDILKGYCTPELTQDLELAEGDLNRAINLAAGSWLRHELPQLHAKRAKVYREMGLLARNQHNQDDARRYFRKAQADFETALGIGRCKITKIRAIKSDFDRYDIRVDSAEFYFHADRGKEADRMLAELQKDLPDVATEEGLKSEYCRLRGKMERLRMEMAQQDGQILDALKHAICAHSYFTRFSPLDRKRKSMALKTQELLLQLVMEGHDNIYEILDAWLGMESPQPYDEVFEYVEQLR